MLCTPAWGRPVKSATPSIGELPFGTSPDGRPVTLYTLGSGRRMAVRILNYGAVVQSIDVPDRRGRTADVVLGFPNLNDYVNDDLRPGQQGTTYFGATVGRYANRIANGRFSVGGVTYQLPINNAPNTLHGGPLGFNTKLWQAVPSVSSKRATLTLSYTSPDGEQGFPGALTVTVTFTVTASNELRIAYQATTSRPTVLNLTNHSYFNLAGEGSGTIEGQRLMINADSYTPVDANLIPTGAISPVAGTPLDFRRATPIGARLRSDFPQMQIAHGYDHNWILKRSRPGVTLAARAEDPRSGRVLTAYTDEPGLQVYTGNFLNGSTAGPSGRTYRQSDAFTLETQHFPDSPNEPSFPTTTLLPGQQFNSTTVYRFSVSTRHR
ncbi:MAG TPA: aldose epimerase family protein [Solirubrobacteraceae bacterium]|jgi:aldose 1-epimerase|nr:aldose epimerase family protein [Solirubrobacteraceae bacterium]